MLPELAEAKIMSSRACCFSACWTTAWQGSALLLGPGPAAVPTERNPGPRPPCVAPGGPPALLPGTAFPPGPPTPGLAVVPPGGGWLLALAEQPAVARAATQPEALRREERAENFMR